MLTEVEHAPLLAVATQVTVELFGPVGATIAVSPLALILAGVGDHVKEVVLVADAIKVTAAPLQEVAEEGLTDNVGGVPGTTLIEMESLTLQPPAVATVTTY